MSRNPLHHRLGARTFRMGLGACLVLAIIAPPRQPSAQEPTATGCPDGPDLTDVLEAHGSTQFDEVRSLDFTFNVTIPDPEAEGGTRQLARTWHWNRSQGQVTLSASGAEAAEPQVFASPPPADAGDEVREADRGFLNDRYWLLFPLQLAWEEGVEVVVECAPQALPLGDGEARRFTATYTGSGGYTPGDAYDFFVAPDGRILQWVFRRGDAAEATFAVTFDDYTEVGPLNVSLTRRDGDGERRVWFTDVAASMGESPDEADPTSDP